MQNVDTHLLTYEQAGARIGHKAKWIAKQVNAGKLRGLKFGYRTRRIEELELIRFIASCRTPLPTMERRGGGLRHKLKPQLAK